MSGSVKISFLSSLFLALVCASSPSPPTCKEASVMLWAASPFGFYGGKANQTMLDAYIRNASKLKDVVDTFSLVAYFVNSTSGALVRGKNMGLVMTALKKKGFRVEPLVGDLPGGNTIAEYRRVWTAGPVRDAFRAACVREVKEFDLDGLNFDFEPNDCATGGTPCSDGDGKAFANLLSDIQTDLNTIGPNIRVSADTGQSAIARTGVLNVSSAAEFITMNTYYDRKSFDIALPRDLANDGRGRFGLGVCPSCEKTFSVEDVEYRMGQATHYGVCYLGYWASLKLDKNTTVWWDNIRQWKKNVTTTTTTTTTF